MESIDRKSITRTIAIVFLIHYAVIIIYLVFILVTLDPHDPTSEIVLSLPALHGIASVISVPYVIYSIVKYMASRRRNK